MADIILKDPKQLLLGAELASASLAIDFGASVSGVATFPVMTSFASADGLGGDIETVSDQTLSLDTVVGGVVTCDVSPLPSSVASAVGCEASLLSAGVLIKVTSASATITFA